MKSSATPSPLGSLSVGELFDLLAASPEAVEERLGTDLALLPLEPWVSAQKSGLRDATLTGRAQLVRTTIGRQAPAAGASAFPIRRVPLCQIGRSRQTAIRIDQPTISRAHADVMVANGRVSIRDCGSYNGTLVNGRLLEPGEVVPLTDGDVVTLGEAQLLFGSLRHLATLMPAAT
jgi:pSer/pThr/pTyr-binding forkhead associated (FHA) protein